MASGARAWFRLRSTHSATHSESAAGSGGSVAPLDRDETGSTEVSTAGDGSACSGTGRLASARCSERSGTGRLASVRCFERSASGAGRQPPSTASTSAHKRLTGRACRSDARRVNVIPYPWLCSPRTVEPSWVDAGRPWASRPHVVVSRSRRRSSGSEGMFGRGSVPGNDRPVRSRATWPTMSGSDRSERGTFRHGLLGRMRAAAGVRPRNPGRAGEGMVAGVSPERRLATRHGVRATCGCAGSA